jgi:WD40 repeat protein
VFDLIAKQNVSTVRNAHNEDISTVCFANRDSSDVVFSGGDDAMIKIWDRRAFGP